MCLLHVLANTVYASLCFDVLQTPGTAFGVETITMHSVR